MKRVCLVISMAMLGLAGCATGSPEEWDAGIAATERQTRSTDMWTVDTALQNNITSGVIMQRTIYAYHFDPGTARLTELGQRDIGILAGYYKTTPGVLNVMRGDATAELYAARTSSVKAALKDAGVNVDQVQLVAGVPGGTGMSSQEIVDAGKRESEALKGSSLSSPAGQTGGNIGSSSDSGMKGSGQ